MNKLGHRQVARQRVDSAESKAAFDSAFTRAGFFTTTGARIVIDDPWANEVRIEDIGWALARTCRFGRNLRAEFEHYSVAQHSVLVSCICKNKFVGLLHDAGEAYYMDVIRPWKRVLKSPEYDALVREWDLRIGHEFGIGNSLTELPPDVVEADNVLLATEIRDMYYSGILHEVGRSEPLPGRLVPFGVRQSYSLFMERFELLC